MGGSGGGAVNPPLTSSYTVSVEKLDCSLDRATQAHGRKRAWRPSKSRIVWHPLAIENSDKQGQLGEGLLERGGRTKRHGSLPDEDSSSCRNSESEPHSLAVMCIYLVGEGNV